MLTFEQSIDRLNELCPNGIVDIHNLLVTKNPKTDKDLLFETIQNLDTTQVIKTRLYLKGRNIVAMNYL